MNGEVAVEERTVLSSVCKGSSSRGNWRRSLPAPLPKSGFVWTPGYYEVLFQDAISKEKSTPGDVINPGDFNQPRSDQRLVFAQMMLIWCVANIHKNKVAESLPWAKHGPRWPRRMSWTIQYQGTKGSWNLNLDSGISFLSSNLSTKIKKRVEVKESKYTTKTWPRYSI